MSIPGSTHTIFALVLGCWALLLPMSGSLLAQCPCSLENEDAPVSTTGPADVLMVAADPDALPFSNKKFEGFQNKIADVLARELGMKLAYHWRPQPMGISGEALKDADADIVIATPADAEKMLTSAVYLRTGYVFVARKGTPAAAIESMDNPALRAMKIAVPTIEDAKTPPAMALAARKNLNLVPFADPPTPGEPSLMTAVAQGKADIAIVWGPVAGYYAARSKVPLSIRPATGRRDEHFAVDISIGVRHGKLSLLDRVNMVLREQQIEIGQIFDAYNVPRVEASASKQ